MANPNYSTSNTSAHAMYLQALLISLYGHGLHSANITRIDKWLADHPDEYSLLDDSSINPYTIDVCTDWVNWTSYNALRWMQQLDQYERRYRVAGLEYHKIPYATRHPAASPNDTEKTVYQRMAQVLETGRSRTQMSFFVPWKQIKNVAVDTLKKIAAHDPMPQDVGYLRGLTARLNAELDRNKSTALKLVAGLKWLEAAVKKASENSALDANDDLTEKHNIEGSLLRSWVHTFPEMEGGVFGQEYPEIYVQRLLSHGVENYAYHSRLLDASIDPRKK